MKPVTLRRALRKAYDGLLPQQKALQQIRLWLSLLTLCFAIAFLIAHSTQMPIARINCAHLDVALGLYKSLRTSISLLTFGLSLLVIESSLTDSEIQILTVYTESQVSGAPQYIWLKRTEYCKITFQTYFNLRPGAKKFNVTDNSKTNTTTNCVPYGSVSLFDYRDILQDAQLSIILAYAYESDNVHDQQYFKRTLRRARQYHVAFPVAVFEVIAQLVIIFYGYLLYQARDKEKDLSAIPHIYLHVIAAVALAAGLAMTAAAATLSNAFLLTRREIASGMGKFGISLKFGSAYFALIWTTTAFAIISMLSWIGPVWCANPHLEYEDELLPDFVPYPIDSKARFFDEPSDEKGHANIAELPEACYEPKEPVELSSRQSERELMLLGEKLSQSRRFGRSKTTLEHLNWLPGEQQTYNLLYADNPFSTHQYPKETLTAKPGLRLTSQSKLPTKGRNSYLNDQEERILDNAVFINKIV